MLTVRGSAKSGHDMSGRWSKVAMWGWNALPPPPMLMLSFCCPPSVAWAQATAAAPCATSSSAMQPSTQATRVRALLPLSLLPAGSGAAATTAAALFGAAANLPTCQPACLSRMRSPCRSLDRYPAPLLLVRPAGGPLLDSRGRLIGINTAIADPTGKGSSSGIGFAIPVDSGAGLGCCCSIAIAHTSLSAPRSSAH